MVRFSKVEWDNGRGPVEEVSLQEVSYNATLFGFIRTVIFFAGNAHRNTPQISSGTHTPVASSTTTLTDSAAKFRRDLVQPGDIVVNTLDSNAVWEVVKVVSTTVLTVQLVESGGVDDDWDQNDTYTIKRRNLEDIYIPYSTVITVTGRDVNKPIFEGVVQEAIPVGDQGRGIKIIAISRESELRDGTPQTDAPSEVARSVIIQDAIDDKAPDTNAFLFPKISSFEGEPGLDHSPNLKLIQPDFSKTSRTALPMFLDQAKSEQWCPDAIREPTLRPVTFDVNNADQELIPEAQGNLAQSFTVPTHMLVPKVGLRLGKTEAVGGNLDLTNLYVRIEANDPKGEKGAGAGNDIPSGELLTPWAESTLISVEDVSSDANGTIRSFVFNQPIALRPSTTYWLVLSYQEDSEDHVLATDFVRWRKDETAPGGFANGKRALYASGAWTVPDDDDHAFEIFEYTDAVWLYETGSDTWTDFTTQAALDDTARFSWMGPTNEDRHYVRTAGPILGLDLLLEVTFASAEYGVFTVRYFGDDGAKITGAHTGADNASVLTDSDKDFRRTGIAIGDVIFNRIDNSYAVITAFDATTITAILQGPTGTDEDWDLGDSYSVLGLEQRLTGTATSGTATVLTDSGANFRRDGVRAGDLVVNTTDNTVGVITTYNATTITVAGGIDMLWSGSDGYKVLSKWRTLTLKDNEQTFKVANTPRLEWEIPSDWVPEFLEAGKPEPSSPGFTDVTDMRGYWLTVECATIPGTRALVDVVTPIPGTGFVLQVTDQTHEDAVLAAGGVHDGSGGAATLTDTGEDFIGTHGILIGDIVENLTDGSRGTITAITTTTNIHDTLVATLAGGGSNDWQVGEEYRVLRDRFRVRYFRNGSRPLGLPANFGLTLRQGAGSFKQMKPLLSPEFSSSTRSSVNRVRVVGRTTVPGVVDRTVNNLRAQREFGRVVFKTITDYTIRTDDQADDRGNTELARLSNRARRGTVKLYTLPFFTRTRERQSWFASGTGLLHKLDGSSTIAGIYEHDGAGNAISLTDTSQNFKKWGVEVGDLLTNITDGSSTVITAITTTTNENDTLVGVLTGGTEDDWDVDDEYSVEERTYVQVGDLIQVKVNDEDGYIDADYMVAGIKYHEPSFVCTLRLAQNLIAPTIGDQQTESEILQRVKDQADMAAQRGGFD